jgi:hypothetical protein
MMTTTSGVGGGGKGMHTTMTNKGGSSGPMLTFGQCCGGTKMTTLTWGGRGFSREKRTISYYDNMKMSVTCIVLTNTSIT